MKKIWRKFVIGWHQFWCFNLGWCPYDCPYKDECKSFETCDDVYGLCF